MKILEKFVCILNGHIWMGENNFGNRCSRCGKMIYTEYGKKFTKQFCKLQKFNSGATFSELMDLTKKLIK